jgi:folate-dependent tRNA-U54 methylase TrmFO/GidA
MIKRLYPLLGGLFISVTAMAQSSNDALLYSPMQPHGTARTQA